MVKRMKKLIVAAVAAALTLGLGMTALAVDSPSVSGIVTKITSAVDKNGNAVNVKIQPMPEKYKQVAEEIKNIENVKKVLGDAFVEGMEVIDVQDVVIEGDASAVEFPVTVTFEVPGVISTTKVAVLHYLDSEGNWESVPCKAGNGTIEATFNSLSPVAFVVDKNTMAGTSAGKSPKTGEGMLVPYMGAAAVVLLIGAAVCLRKREVR